LSAVSSNRKTTIQIDTAEVFEPLLAPARYKGAYGGRGSGKSVFFAEMLIDDAIRIPGLRAVCIREVQKSLKESAKRLLEDTINKFGVSSLFTVLADRIVTPGNGVIIFQGMQDHTAESIKSLEGFQRALVEEAQTLSARSLELLRPTIRAEHSELWFSWNPRTKNDPVDMMFRGKEPPHDSVCVSANWSDNPWFPSVLHHERLDCKKNDPDRYAHIWEGDYVSIVDGAYFAEVINTARKDNRITRIYPDPLQSIRLFWDIGGTGAKADACAIWVAQFVGHDVKVLDYYEAQGQPLEAHLAWLRGNGYGPERAGCWLPHDGATHDRVYAVSYESALRSAGYDVVVVPNQGRGAAMQRVEAVRRLFPRVWFDVEKCSAGIEALSWYHEKRDEARGIGLGPEHDWSSHGSDAFGLMAITYEEPRTKQQVKINFKGWG
jgi:phage terminase large subunit